MELCTQHEGSDFWRDRPHRPASDHNGRRALACRFWPQGAIKHRLQALQGVADAVALDLFDDQQVVSAVRALAPDVIISTVGAGTQRTAHGR
ncbi:MAG: hypothetical protein MZV49_10950 [Rhodopseudomonas palustris]|nr:hypothetical protein [Rhodopseudomonas palustris]